MAFSRLAHTGYMTWLSLWIPLLFPLLLISSPCHNHCFISNIKHFVTLVCITYDLMSLLPLFSLTNAALGRYKGIVSFLLPTTSFLTIPTCLTWVLLMSHMSLYMFLSPVWASGLWIPPGCLVRVHPPWRVRLPPLLQACKAPAPLQTHSSPSSPESLPSLRLPHLHLEKGFGKSPWRPWPSLLHASTRVRFYCHHHHYHHLALVLGRVNHASIHMQCFHLFFGVSPSTCSCRILFWICFQTSHILRVVLVSICQVTVGKICPKKALFFSNLKDFSPNTV